MADRSATYRAEIELNAKQAKNELKQLEDQQKRLNEQQKALYASGSQKNHQLARDMQKDIDSVSAKIREQKKYISGLSNSVKDLSEMSYKELNQTVRALNKELRSGRIERNSREYKILAERVKACRHEMDVMNTAVREQPGLFSRLSDGVNKYAAIVGSAIASVTGLTMTIRKTVSDYAKMDDEMVNVQKYTGMTKEQVVALNEEFKKMDTRTSREQLNQIADAAGRLGLQTQEAVMQFVDAADKINVALGDDLGDEAVGQIGKMAMAFGEDKKHGLNKAMLATGSVVNELSQTSSASGSYLVDFAARMAGIAAQAKLTIPQIMSFGSVLDQNMQQVEVSATALNQLITAMFKEPSKFAQLAGMEVGKFTKLLKTDANQALLEFFAAMKNSGGFDKLAPMFDSMGLSGSRCVQVLSVLANKLDDVVVAENTANKAYDTGNSVLDEFRRANESAQAQLEKAQKHFHDLSVELGEQLMPVVKYTITGASLLVKTLSAIVPWLKNNISYIGKLVIVLGTYLTITKLNVLWKQKKILLEKTDAALTKISTIAESTRALVIAKVTRNTQAATAAQAELNTVTKANPWGLVASAIATVIVVLETLISKNREAAEAAKAHADALDYNAQKAKVKNEIEERANQSAAESITKVKTLTAIVENNNAKLEDRQAALKELKRMVPSYHGALTKEGTLINNNIEALKQYCDHLIDAARAQAAFNKMVELQGSTMEHQRQSTEKQKQIDAARVGIEALGLDVDSQFMGWSGGKAIFGKIGESVDKQKQLTEEQYNQWKNLRNVYDYNVKRKKEEDASVANNEKLTKELEKQAKSSAQIVTSQSGGSGGGDTTTVTIPKGNKSTYVDPKESKKQQQMQKTAERQRKAEEREAERKRKEALKKAVDGAKAEYSVRNALAIGSYRQGVYTYSQYLDEMHKNTELYYEKLASIYGKDTAEYQKLLQNKEKAEQEYEDDVRSLKLNDLEIDHAKKVADIKTQYYDRSNTERYQNEEALNEALFMEEMDYIRRQQKLYGEGSKEWHNLELQRTKSEEEHKLELQENYQKMILQYRKDMGKQSVEEQQEIELQGVKFVFDAMVEAGQLGKDQAKAQLDEIANHIKEKYKELGLQQDVENAEKTDVKANAATKLEQAKKLAGVSESNSPQADDMASGVFSIFSAVEQRQLVNAKLKELYDQDKMTYAEYQEAKKQLDQDTTDAILAGATVALNGISNMLSAASSYAQACSDLETARISANYQKQIDAAGNNSKKKERLEKKRDAELAKAKTKANKKAMKIEIAQALAQTALSAITAYASASEVSWVLGPIAAAMATAAGMIQIATIKKQHQAEEAGYYEGGYTSGNRYRREAGVVHEGEFVANHQAVNNQQLRPVFNLIDTAQRNNRVASLSADDVARSIGRGNTEIAPTVVNVETDTGLQQPIKDLNNLIDILQARLAQPMEARLDRERTYKDYKDFLRLKSNPR